jgi:hypothetical protein
MTDKQPLRGWAPPQPVRSWGTTEARTPEELAELVHGYQSRGWTIIEAGPAGVTLSAPKEQTSTAAVVGHVVLVLVTAGLWLPIWLLLLATRNKRTTVTLRLVPESG